jgi:hypothetical protein
MSDVVGLIKTIATKLCVLLLILQKRSGQNADAKTWRRVLMYAPESLVLECADKIRRRFYRAARRIAR